MNKIILALALSLTSVFTWAQENYNLEQRGHLPFPGKELANIWGYADSLGNEYALVGTSTGLSIVDVTNPDLPVLRFEVNGVTSIWREIKTWQGFAYVTTEGQNGGLTVVDLRSLPDTIYSHVYRGNGAIQNQLSTIHALHIEAGYCYVYGANIGNQGVIILDLADPWNPNYQGMFNDKYVHDGYVYNDTLWAAHILDGYFGVIDVSDKTNPFTLVEKETPNTFTHNTWMTSTRRTLLTTDEVSNSYLTSYDVQDINNITELDRFQTAAGSGAIVHNTIVLNDYALTSWYTEGVVVVDAARPQNLIEVGKNDFSAFEGNGFNGCWGVYPYLPSGTVIASDIETGLYVMTPTYVRGCYFEGVVLDSSCAEPLDGVTVRIEELDIEEITAQDGSYRTGTAFPGTYTVTFSKLGYQSKTFTNVVFENGVLDEREVRLYSASVLAVNGTVLDESNQPISGAVVALSDQMSSYQLNTNVSGEYAKCGVQPGIYQEVVGKWGYVTACVSNIDVNSGISTLETNLEPGYYDDFQFNFGWTVTSTASAGIWTRAIPAGTAFSGQASNPGVDVNDDCNGFAYVTGNVAGNGAGDDDVDNGSTTLNSPWMDLSTYENPYLSFHRWFFNGGGNDTPNDTLYIRVEVQGGSTYTLKKIAKDTTESRWQLENFRLLNYLPSLGTVRFQMEAMDQANGHLVEAGLDLFSVLDSLSHVGIFEQELASQELKIYPNPSSKGQALRYSFAAEAGHQYQMQVCDLQGRILINVAVSAGEGTLNGIQELREGVYVIRLLDGGRSLQTKRFVRTN